MSRIWKYRLDLGRVVTHEVPMGAHIAHFGFQDGEPHVWLVVNVENDRILHHYVIYGTGQESRKHDCYMDSCQHGAFMWHLYETDKP